MNSGHGDRDLLVLVADLDTEQAVLGLLNRSRSLGIASLDFETRRHPGRDSGCRLGAAEYLRSFLHRYHHALVLFDLHGSGSLQSRENTRQEVQEKLNRNGWETRARVIVIEPELESWVWTPSPIVPEVLGWKGSYSELKSWLSEKGFWPDGTPKPPDPKAALEHTLYKVRSRRSARRFFDLASRVSLTGCRDPAFNELRATLRSWFPSDGER